ELLYQLSYTGNGGIGCRQPPTKAKHYTWNPMALDGPPRGPCAWSFRGWRGRRSRRLDRRRGRRFVPRCAGVERYRIGEQVPAGDEQGREQRADDKAVQAEYREPAQGRNEHDVVGHLGILAHQDGAQQIVD